MQICTMLHVVENWIMVNFRIFYILWDKQTTRTVLEKKCIYRGEIVDGGAGRGSELKCDPPYRNEYLLSRTFLKMSWDLILIGDLVLIDNFLIFQTQQTL